MQFIKIHDNKTTLNLEQIIYIDNYTDTQGNYNIHLSGYNYPIAVKEADYKRIIQVISKATIL